MNTSVNNTPATVNNNRVNNAAKIQDFGQKIGGARKDLAREQADLVAAFAGLTVESLKTLSLSKVVKFEQVQRLAVSGAISAPAACAAFALWRSIPARPSLSWKVGSWAEKTAARLAQISAIIDGGEITENIKRMAEYRVLMAAGYPAAPFSFGRYSVDYYLTVNSPLCVMAGRYYKLRTNDPSEAAEFIRKAVAADAATRAEGATFELYCSRGVYYAAPKGKNKIRVKEWNTREEARAGMEDVAELRRLWEKIRNTPALRRTTNRPRVGVDYRQGQNMNPEAFAAAFPFRGVEFGNWLTQTDRAIRLNETFDALRDLCALCGLTADAATLKGWLAMAFGSRGIPGAAAHFEHEHRVINLTKEHGAGSLAHEWLHALDAFTAARFAGSLGQFAIKDWGKLPEGELREAARALYSGLIKSPFARRSEDLDYLKGKTYYAKAQELAARAFEVYVIELAKIKGWTLDFLANVTTREEWIAAYGDADEYPYPTPAEVAELAPLFARFLSLAADAQELSKEAAQLFADGRAIMEQQREKAKELQEQAAQEQAEQRAAATAARMEEMKQRTAEVCAECGASWSYVFESAGRAYAVGGGAGFAFHIWANGHVGFKVVRLNSRIKKSIRTAWGDTLEVRPGVDLEAFARKDLQYGFTGYSLYNSVFKGYATTWQEFSEKHAEDIRKGAQEFASKAQEVKKEATTSETAAQPTNTKANDGKPAQKPAKGEKRNRQEIDTTAAPAESLQLVEIADGVAVIPAEGYDYRATLFNRRQIKAHGATWNKEAQQWQATDPATVEALRAWFAQSAPAADEQQEQATEPATASASYSDSEKSEIPAIAANRLTPADEPEPVAIAASYGSESETSDAVPAAYYSGSEKSEACSLYNFRFKNRTAEQWNCLTKFDTEADGEKLLQKTAEGHGLLSVSACDFLDVQADYIIYFSRRNGDYICMYLADFNGQPLRRPIEELRGRLLDARKAAELKQIAQSIQEADREGCAYEIHAGASVVRVDRDPRTPGHFRATWYVSGELDERRKAQTAEDAAGMVWLLRESCTAEGKQFCVKRPKVDYSEAAKSEDPASATSLSTVSAGAVNDEDAPAALLKRYQERKQKLLAIGYPYYSRLKNEDGSFNIPTSDESTYWDYAAGVITIEEAARELCRCGFTNTVDENYTRIVFARINERLHKLDDDLKPIKVAT